MTKQTRYHFPEIDIANGTVIQFVFDFGDASADIGLPDNVQRVGILRPQKFSVFVVDETVCVIETKLLNKRSPFDFGSYNNSDALCKERTPFGGCRNRIKNQ